MSDITRLMGWAAADEKFDGMTYCGRDYTFADAKADAREVLRQLTEAHEVERASGEIRRGLDAKVAELSNALSEASPKWIAVSERSPRDEQRVLVYKAGVTSPCDIETDRASVMYESGFVHNDGVTHWMPLPEAPK